MLWLFTGSCGVDLERLERGSDMKATGGSEKLIVFVVLPFSKGLTITSSGSHQKADTIRTGTNRGKHKEPG